MRVFRTSTDTKALLDPTSSAWDGAKAQTFDLTPTPIALQPSPWIQGAFEKEKWGRLAKANMRMLHNGESIAVRVEWTVETPATSTTGPDEFADACAVMFPFVKDAPVVMGSAGQWVNMWLWRADNFGPFAVTAAGIGTSERASDNALQATARYKDKSWQVVFARALEPANTRDHVPLKPGTGWQVAVALWQGANQERAGLKSYSPHWTDLEIAS